MKKLGIPTQLRKCASPSTKIKYLGYNFDTIKEEVSMPSDKIYRYLSDVNWLIDAFLSKRRVKIITFQKIVGKLRSLQNVYVYMIPFLRRLEEICSSHSNNHHFTKIDGETYRDLLFIKKLLLDASQNSMPMKFLLHPKDNCDVKVLTDASTKFGVGGYT